MNRFLASVTLDEVQKHSLVAERRVRADSVGSAFATTVPQSGWRYVSLPEIVSVAELLPNPSIPRDGRTARGAAAQRGSVAPRGPRGLLGASQAWQRQCGNCPHGDSAASQLSAKGQAGLLQWAVGSVSLGAWSGLAHTGRRWGLRVAPRRAAPLRMSHRRHVAAAARCSAPQAALAKPWPGKVNQRMLGPSRRGPRADPDWVRVRGGGGQSGTF